MFLILLINFLLAISTTIGMTIVPFLVTDSLGCSLLTLGLIEGFTECMSNVLRLYSGVLFDKVRNKKNLFVFSTGFALLSKLLLFFPSAASVIIGKAIERVANGVFASPRDAYVAEKAGKNKGVAMSLLNVSRAIGCVFGPLSVSMVTILVGPLCENTSLLIAACCTIVVPAFALSFLIDLRGTASSNRFSFSAMLNSIAHVEPVLIVTFLFFLGRFNDGLLMIYLKSHGFPEWFYLMTISIFNATMLISSPFIGSRIDAGKIKSMLKFVLLAMLVFQVAFYSLSGVCWTLAVLGLIGWGIQRGGSQIVFASMIFKNTPKHLYGTTIGAYYLVSGVGTLIASSICGRLSMTDMRYPLIYSGLTSLIAIGYMLKVGNKLFLGQEDRS